VLWINGSLQGINDLTLPRSPVIGDLAGINGTGQRLTGGSVKLLTPMSQISADLNHDGIVNGADLAQVLGNWTGSK